MATPVEPHNRPSAPGRAVRRDPLVRVRRNFWILLLAATMAAGLTSVAVRLPPSPAVGLLTACSSLAAVTAVALAGRILVVMSRARTRQGGRAP
jgi:hypothetical protein